MKKDLLTALDFFRFFAINYPRKQLKLLLILILSIFYTSFLEAQTRTHLFNANGSLILPAGINVVTVEAWGSGGAGGGAVSTLAEGRGAGGGGGGAYAKGDITTVTPQTLNIIVGTATTGTSGNGASGGASYVDTYNTVVYAPGGTGGTANTSGGAPAGGPGGTSPIGATARNAGNAGNPGASSLLGLGAIFNSGAGGNSGNTAGGIGTGGAALNSLLLGNNPGNPGNEPGGGGSGGMASLAQTQIGGGGARGRVNITYICKTYSLTGTSAPNVCTGTTSQVQLTGTATSLPAGTYTVTYNTSLPNATGKTEPMIVSTAGSGSFTARGLTTLGNCTITITSLTSVDCTSSISTNNVANIIVSAQPTITLGTTTALCASASLQNVALPYTGVTNTPTNYSITWNASPANSFLPVTNAVLPATPINIAVPAGTAAGTYTGSLTVSNAAGCVSAAATNFTITVNPLPTITLGATTAVCISLGAQSTTLPYSATANSPTNYSITWNASPTNTFASVFNAPLPASQINIPIPANTAAGTYTGTLTVSNANGCVSAANNFTVTVNPLPTITLGSAGAVCLSAGVQSTSLSYSAVTNAPTSYSIVWNASPTNNFLPVTDASLPAGSINIAVPAGTAVGTYTGTLTVKNANGCVSSGNSFTVTVNPLPTITLGSAGAVCFSAGVQSTSLSYSAVTNAPTTYSIVWNASPTNNFLPVTDASLTAGSINIAVPAGTAAGTYTGTLTVKNANGCVSSGNSFTVTVNPLPTITLGSAGAVCLSAGVQSTSLSYSAVTNAPTSYSIVWNASPTNNFLPVTDASLAAGSINIAVPAGTAAGTYTGTLTVKNANGCVSSGNSFTVTVNPLPTITLGSAGAVCFSAGVQSTSLSYSAVTNAPTSYSIVWNASPTNNFLPVTDASLTAGSINIAIPAGTAAGTYTGTLTVKNANGCVSSGNSFTVTVNPLPTITLGSAGAVCFSAGVQSTSLSYSAVTNAPTTYSIVWNASPTNNFLPITDASLTAGSINIAVPAGTAAGTYTGTLTVKNANGCVSSGNSFTVTVNPLPTIMLGSAGAVCFSAGVQSASLSYSAVTNAPTSYSIVWNASPTNNFLPVTDASLTAGSINIAIPAGTAAGTYTGTLTVKNANGCVSSGNSFTVTVNPLPTITLGSAGAVCFSAGVQSTSLSYSAVTNAPTTYSIVWNASPTNNFLPITDASLTAGSINIAVPAGTAAGTYTGTLTVKNANGCVSSGNSFTVTVNSQPTITTSGNLTSICQSASAQVTSLLYSATTGSPTSYSIDWATLNDQGNTSFSFNSGGGNINNINVPLNTPAGTYSGIMTVFASNGCSITQAVSLTVYDVPTISTGGVFSPVCQSSSSQSTTLSYNSTTGSPISYEIDWIALTDQGATPFPFSSGSGDIINVNVPANTVAGTYNGVMTITTSNGCPATQAVSLTVNSVSVAPTASVTQQPTCVNNTGIITVTSPASGTGYAYSIDGVDFSNTTGIFTGLSSGIYYVKVKNSTSNCESEATSVTINAFVTKVWNGNTDASWGNPANWTPTGVPIASDCVDIPDVGIDPIISGTNASFFASRLTVENNGSLIVEETNSITVTNEVTVLGNGILIFEDKSSLVQVADVANVGVITYRRKTPVRRFDLTYWSSPVTRNPGITMNEFSPETYFDKYLYWTSDFKWGTNLYGTMVMNAGEGYSIRGPQSFSTVTASVFTGEFIGVPNNGTIQGPPARAEKYCFFGNPYPSAIYADQFIHDNAANFYGTLYFWTHNTSPRIAVPGGNTATYSNDDYAIYNLSGDTTVGNLSGTGATSPGNQEPLHGYIAAGQGFFAKARTGQSAVFTNSMRVPNSNSQFYKSAKTEVVEKHRVWLNFTNTQGAFKQLLIGYITGATNSFDFNYDAATLNANPYVDFYSINEGKKLAIQGRALPFAVTDTIPLGYKSTIEEGDFTIAIDRADGDLANQDIYLQDKVTNTIYNLRSGGYTFTSAPGTFLDRFVLRYTNSNGGKPLGNEDFENQDQQIFVSVKDKNIKLESFSEQENLQEATVYDTGGTLLYRKKQIGNKEWVITNFQSGPQVLLVKITLDSGKIVTKKIVFK